MIPRNVLVWSDFTVSRFCLIQHPTEIFVGWVDRAVMVFDADPHLEVIVLHQWSETSGLEDGRPQFFVPLAKLMKGEVQLTVFELGGTPGGLELREAVSVPRHLHLTDLRISESLENAVVGVGARLGRPLPRERAGRARGG